MAQYLLQTNSLNSCTDQKVSAQFAISLVRATVVLDYDEIEVLWVKSEKREKEKGVSTGS